MQNKTYTQLREQFITSNSELQLEPFNWTDDEENHNFL